ncbi:flagellar biosynthetic protein FliO [Metabacillus idriensis]|uniref:flagellar biosynthetic protein FliO n=1 Tax=Metabacillus idriensis TaxID=324768 RepID=UPI003D269A5E
MKIKWIPIAVILLIFLHPLSHSAVHAEQGAESVADWVGSDEKKTDGKSEKNSGTSDAEYQAADTSVTAWDFIKMILATAFILVLIYILLKFVSKRNKFTSSSKFIENLGGTNVGQNRSIQLIKVGKKILVVGVSDSVQLLKEIDDEDEYREITEEHQQRFAAAIDTKDWLKNVSAPLFRHKNNGMADGQSFSFKEQLEQLKKERRSSLEDLAGKDDTK